MRSSLFGENVETTPDTTAAQQNPRMLKVHLDNALPEFYARQETMVAYQGDVDFQF